MLVLETTDFVSAEEVAHAMHQISETYKYDMLEYMKHDIFTLFDIVKKIPYVVEDGFFQSLARPYNSMHGIAPYVACANKSIIISSWAKLVGIRPAYILASIDKNMPFHHVYTVLYYNNKRLIVDATYPENIIGYEYDYQRKKEI